MVSFKIDDDEDEADKAGSKAFAMEENAITVDEQDAAEDVG